MTWEQERKRYERVKADHRVIAEAAMALRHDARMASYGAVPTYKGRLAYPWQAAAMSSVLELMINLNLEDSVREEIVSCCRTMLQDLPLPDRRVTASY